MPYSSIFTILVCFLEIGLWLPIGRSRILRAKVTVSLLIVATIWFVYDYANWFGLSFALIAAYRVLNLYRFILQRRQKDHLLSTSRRASCWLLLAQLVSFALAITYTQFTETIAARLIGALAVGGVAIVFTSTQRNLYKTRPISLDRLKIDDVPTLSVLIPARNETDDLSACLSSLTASTYPKLEIIVLDDCSQNKRTPEIIKDFAQAGVRFIAGAATPDKWLAKNYAYQQLEQVASGQLLLFCGVDTRYKPETLTYMVSELLARNKTMMSYMPANAVPTLRDVESSIIQPSRYSWELSLPRRRVDRPPVLSTAWLIDSNVLKAAGGFKSFKKAAVPERFLARYASQHGDGYSFTQSDTEHGLANVKTASEQRATVIRTRYPQLHQSIEFAALTTALEVTVLLAPFITYFEYLSRPATVTFIVADVLCILLICMFAQVCNVTYRKYLWRSIWLFPFAVLYDIFLLHYSMYKYEFGTVDWKGRNVCIPVMDVIPRLPKS